MADQDINNGNWEIGGSFDSHRVELKIGSDDDTAAVEIELDPEQAVMLADALVRWSKKVAP